MKSPTLVSFWAGALLVALWRGITAVQLHPSLSDPELALRTMAVMGLWFLAWGLWALHRRPSRETRLLAGYCLCAGVHWGGAPGIGPPELQSLSLAVYITISVLGASLFFHLALAAAASRAATRLLVLVAIYTPPALATLLTVYLLAKPSDRSRLQLLVTLMLVATVFEVFGGLIWIGRWVKAIRSGRTDRHLGLVTAALILGSAPGLLIHLTPVPPWLGNLPLVVLPPALALALVRSEKG